MATLEGMTAISGPGFLNDQVTGPSDGGIVGVPEVQSITG